jgi:hypothetical protein
VVRPVELDGDATALLASPAVTDLNSSMVFGRVRADANRTYADAMVDHAATLSKAEANKVLLRVGFSQEKITNIFSELEDPIDFDRDVAVLEKYGITRDVLEDLMGGSP